MIMSIAINLTLCLLRQGLSEPEFYGDLVYKLLAQKILAFIGIINFAKPFLNFIYDTMI